MFRLAVHRRTHHPHHKRFAGFSKPGVGTNVGSSNASLPTFVLGAELAKADVNAAYRILPVHHQDH